MEVQDPIDIGERTDKREFLPQALELTSWAMVKPYYDALLQRSLNELSDLKKWLRDRSELEGFIGEEGAWRFIRMTIDTTDQERSDAYHWFISEIEPRVAPLEHQLNEKLLNSGLLEELEEDDPRFSMLTREIRKDVALYREENIPLKKEEKEKAKEYGEITGGMTITVNGEEVTLQKAGAMLRETDRALRKDVFEKVAERRLKEADRIDSVFDEQRRIRQQMAENAGYENFRDFKFREMGRFDYGPADCMRFHEHVRDQVKPLVNRIHEQRKADLGVEKLKPWDLQVDPKGKAPLDPFSTEEELVEKTTRTFQRIHPYFARCLETMRQKGFLDLGSRPGKAPGGYNYPLMESDVPFIFMNAVGAHSDYVTMVHEGGHAVHAFLSKDLENNFFKQCPSEVSELASMAMELFSMEHWDEIYNEEDLKRAKRTQLETVLWILLWVSTIDRFQHWIYENPDHSKADRKKAWWEIASEWGSDVVDRSGQEDAFAHAWQKQLHLFEVPFYYIEYGFAQLGAVALWKQYKEDPEGTLGRYIEALKVGYTRPIGEVYRTAGITFDFSASYIRELTDFLARESKALEA